ncbi:MAG: histidinol dehydrogenase [Vulcanimicrobiaceae bacterium]
MKIYKAADTEGLSRLYASGWEVSQEVAGVVQAIIKDVRERGDRALEEYSRRFDVPDYDLSRLRVPIPMQEQARTLVPDDIARGLQLAKARIKAFHERQMVSDVQYTEEDGTHYGFRSTPLDSVASYVPGGTAVLPSSVLMAVVPAKLAGVRRVIVLTPPQRDGRVNPAVIYASALCGVDELYAVGGAQAIAAAAYGTASVAAVDKIVGPGNVYVTEAKRQVFGVCAIDGLAGPSEVLVIADRAARVEYAVGELLAQAEHDPLARVALVSENRAFLESAAQLLEAFDCATIERGETIATVLATNAYLVHAANRTEVYQVAARFAPEHLSLQVESPEEYLPHIRHAGAVFVGGDTPVAAGDYIAGTNHVLPTSGAARFSSGLRLADFLRTFSVVQNSAQRMQDDAYTLALLADFEGLPQHADSARLRVR